MQNPHITFLNLARLGLGWIFLWAFVDKVFGLGFATEAGKAWVDGVSPTYGYLSFATHGPFSPFFQSIAGHPVVDVLFMLGLLFVGITLLLGFMVRLGSAAGIAVLLLIYLAALPPEHNPLIDDHIMYSLILASFLSVPVGDTFGLGKWWKKQKIVQRYQILQ